MMSTYDEMMAFFVLEDLGLGVLNHAAKVSRERCQFLKQHALQLGGRLFIK